MLNHDLVEPLHHMLNGHCGDLAQLHAVVDNNPEQDVVFVETATNLIRVNVLQTDAAGFLIGNHGVHVL